jgi:hypothetical protein
MLFGHGGRLPRNSGGFRQFSNRRCNFRQSKVEDLRVSALGHEDIGRLDVAVDDAFSVGGI